MDGLLKDFRYGFRKLLQNPGFTLAAVLILALGIGANTVIFSAVHTVLLKSLPYKNPESLILIWGHDRQQQILRNQVSATEIADYRAQNTVFEEITTYTDWRPIISGTGEAERVPAMQVGDGYFKIMKIEPLLGRFFLPEEQQEGKDFVVVLSYGLWQRRFSSDPNIVGKTIRLNTRTYSVVGVAKPELVSLPETLIETRAELYRPVAEAYDNSQRSSRHLRAIGRLKKGITLEAAQSQFNSISERLEKEYPDDSTDIGIHLTGITEDTVGGVRPSLILLSSAAGLVLLIACANLANLLLARAAFRQREFAIRTSLGAGRWRLIRQLLVESSLLALAGGALGLILANWGVNAMAGIGSKVVPVLQSISISMPVLSFTILVSIVSGIFFGMIPALQVSRIDLNEALKEGGRGTGSGSRHHRIRNILVGVEVAVAIVLLASAGLLIQSIARLHGVDPGFNPKNVLTMNVWLPFARYQEDNSRTQFFHRVIENVSALPGVEAAGIVSVLPFSSGFDGRTLSIEGQSRKVSDEPDADMYVVCPGYDNAIGLHLVRGRFISWQDTEKSPLVAVVNETLAQQIWNGADPIGKRIRLHTGPDATPWRTVIGVVRDVKHYGFDKEKIRQFYLPQSQFPILNGTLVVRSELNETTLVSSVRREILSIDRELPVFNIYQLEELMGNSIAVRRISMLLVGGFALIALCLAIAGIYAVVSYATAQRTQEIGIRMTLGAQQYDVVKLVVRQGLTPSLIGAVAGLAGALIAARLMQNLLFDVSPSDPLTLGGVALVLMIVALIACYVPARKASRIDPIEALRYE